MVEGHSNAEAAVRAPRIHDQWMPEALDVEPSFDRGLLPPDLRTRAHQPHFPIGRVQLVALEGGGWRAVSDCRDDGEPWWGAL